MFDVEKWTGTICSILRDMAEFYGFTPQQVGEMTLYQVAVLCSKDAKAAENMALGRETMKLSEFRQRRMMGHG